ncbi:MAG TPA: BON domain-containing protein [Longimicrobiaceae bacterium]
MGRYDDRGGFPGEEWETGYRRRRPRFQTPHEDGWGFAGGYPQRMYGPERYGLGPYYERLRRRRRPDDEIEREVKDALFYDTWVDADAISVEVREGIVTLRGTLPSYDEIRYANDDAWDVDGVVGVHSELEVRE